MAAEIEFKSMMYMTLSWASWSSHETKCFYTKHTIIAISDLFLPIAVVNKLHPCFRPKPLINTITRLCAIISSVVKLLIECFKTHLVKNAFGLSTPHQSEPKQIARLPLLRKHTERIKFS